MLSANLKGPAVEAPSLDVYPLDSVQRSQVVERARELPIIGRGLLLTETQDALEQRLRLRVPAHLHVETGEVTLGDQDVAMSCWQHRTPNLQGLQITRLRLRV